MNIKGPKILFVLPFFNGIPITETVVISWGIILLVFIIIKYLTWNMKKKDIKVPQVLAEKIVMTVNNLIRSSMGKSDEIFAPYVAALFIFSLLSSLSGLVALRPPTADFNMTLTWAMITFFMIHYNGIKYKNILGYIKGYFQPFLLMFPLNIISRLVVPISLSFRHFGNIAAGYIVSKLIYLGLIALSSIIPIFGKCIPILQVGIPAILSIYFDVFAAVIQAFIFISLTITYISQARE